MWRLLSWIGKILATAYGGPGIVVLGDPGLDYEVPYPNAPRWASRIGALAPLAVVLLVFIGLPWPFVAVVAAILLLPMILNQIRAMRRR
jgi:hypothetical protein